MTSRKASSNEKVVFSSNKETFDLLFENHPVPMFIYDRGSLAFLEVNDALIKKLGYTRREFKRLTLKDILAAQEKERLIGNLKKEKHLLQYSGIWNILLKNGSPLDVETTSCELMYDGREAVLVLARDVLKEINEFEGGLAASETEMRSLFAAMQDVVLVIDRTGVFRKVAPTNLGLLFKPMNELLGNNLRDVFSREQADLFLDTIQQVMDTQKPVRIEYELKINERMVWFSTSILPMDDDNTLWVARDITEYKHSEAALRESEERYRSLFDHMMDGVYRSTHEGKFVDINPAMVKMFRYSSREEMLAIDIKNELYFAPEERGSHVLDTGKEEVEAYRMRRKDGSEIWVEDHGSYVHDEQGGLKYHEGILRDITERKRSEDELYRAKDSLEIAHRELQELLAHAQMLARTDGLTGLYNFRYFFELASYEFTAAIRYQRPLSIIIFDTDNLKLVNDTLGHTTGDKMLMMVAQTAGTQVRSVDALARYGGDEFIILLPQTNAQQALPVAERIRASVEVVRIETEKGPLAVTLSIGIAELRLDLADESLENIVRRADKALYSAKAAGRNRTVIFHAES